MINILNGSTTIFNLSEPILADGNSASLSSFSAFIANIFIYPFIVVLVIGTLRAYNLTVNGSVHGPGTLAFPLLVTPSPQITATDIAVQQGTFVLFCFVLFCFVLFCFVLFCFVLFYFI